MNNPLETETDPIQIFTQWLAQAQANHKMSFPTAACLATSTPTGAPSARMVLVKEFSAEGFHIYTNYESRKAIELLQNPQAALCYYWDHEKRQVRIEGTVEKLSREVSLRYFQSRPRESQIGAWASPQSRELSSTHELQERFKTLEKKFEGREVLLPEFWGGFRLVPERMEFWQEAPHRLHSRVLYTRKDSSWEKILLAP